MLVSKLKKITREIKHYGFSSLMLIKITEQIYNKKLKKIGIVYPNDTNNVEFINPLSSNKDSRCNQSTAYYQIKKAFNFTGINYSDICLLDIGCGFGKALNFGMLLNFKSVTGIDLDDVAIERAIVNCKQMQQTGCISPFIVQHADACDYEIPGPVNLIFMANPFGKKTMAHVLENIVTHCSTQKKELYLVYTVPAHKELFAGYAACTKLYESFTADKAGSEMAIFKIGYL